MEQETNSTARSKPDIELKTKDGTEVLEHERPLEIVDAYQNPMHTICDRGDMRRLGKAQEYRRVFGPLATFGFISIYLCTWECTFVLGLLS